MVKWLLKHSLFKKLMSADLWVVVFRTVFLVRFRVNLSCEIEYFVDEKDGPNWLYNYVLWASLVEC